MPKTYSLESAEDMAALKKQWGALPKSMIVIEFKGDGDPFFGGNADDRPLGLNGLILARGDRSEVASFSTIEDAHRAAKQIQNRRPDSILGVAPTWN